MTLTCTVTSSSAGLWLECSQVTAWMLPMLKMFASACLDDSKRFNRVLDGMLNTQEVVSFAV